MYTRPKRAGKMHTSVPIKIFLQVKYQVIKGINIKIKIRAINKL